MLSVGAIVLAGLSGCQTWSSNTAMMNAVSNGQHSIASEMAIDAMPLGEDAREDVGYSLASIRLGMTQLADGQVQAAELPLLSTYEILRTQGINDGRELMLLLQDEEDFSYWKGEPFEQAMAYAYFSAQLASVNDWYNAVVAADNAIFQLNNFEESIGKAKETALDAASTPEERAEVEAAYGEGADPQAVFYAAEQASVREGKVETSDDGKESFEPSEEAFDDFMGTGYVPEETNFVVGYMMQGISALAAGGALENESKARDAFARAVQYNPSLEPLTQALLNGEANTVFWVDYGIGPEKYQYGYADAFAKFRPRMTGSGALSITLQGGAGEYTESGLRGASGDGKFPVAADINSYALDHRWLNLQNARVAKAIFGDTLIASGALLALYADDMETRIAGVFLSVVGWIQKKGAAADIRHIEIMPQRVYFAAAQIDQADTTIEFQVSDGRGSRLRIPGVNPPADGQGFQFRYIRLNSPSGGLAPAWATSGQLVYANDHYEGVVPGDSLPFIMGGTCVRSPSAETLSYYQQNGNLQDLTLDDLEGLYRAENITWEIGDQGGVSVRHVLEGGRSLIPPMDTTAGFARLFCQRHQPYVPTSDELRAYMDSRQAVALR